MTDKELLKLAKEEGFCAAAVASENIPVDGKFRKFCEDNLCGKYSANYSCPPDCGSPEEMKERILAHKKVLVLQTIWQVADYSMHLPSNRQRKVITPLSCVLCKNASRRSQWFDRRCQRLCHVFPLRSNPGTAL